MAGPGLARMAWRNLWRNRRRTVLTLVSIAFGGFIAVLFTAIQDRAFADFIDAAARLGGGHVRLQHPEYLDTPTMTRTVQDTRRLRALATRDEDVEKCVDRITGNLMAASAHDSFSAMFIAYDPAEEDEDTLAFVDGLVAGRLFDRPDERGIILGKTLAHNLGVGLGKKVVYTLTDREGEIVSAMGRVAGIIELGAPSADAGLCLLPVDTARSVLGYAPDEATTVSVFLSDSRRSAEVAERLRAELGEGVAALTWDQAQPDIAAFVAMKVGASRVMTLVIALLVAAGIFNTLFVSVMERLRELGILLALGSTPGHVFRLVMWESFWLALSGLVIGAAVTAGPYLYLHANGLDLSRMTGGQTEIGGVGFDPLVRVAIYPEHLAMIIAAVLLATLAAGLYPAWRACRTEPVDSIKLV